MLQFYIRKGVPLCLFLLACNFISAQSIEQKLKANKTVSEFKMSSELKTPSAIFFTPSSQLPLQNANAYIKNLFQLNAQSNVQLVNSTVVGDNIRVDKYKHYFKGVKVEHSAYNVTSKNGVIVSITAESFPLEDAFSITPQLTGEAAISKAINFTKAQKYAWQALEEDKRLYPGNATMQMRLEGLRQEHTPKPELVIAKDVYGNKQGRLAYKMEVYAVQPLSRNIIYVDAINGKILLRDAIIKHIDKAGKDPKPDSLHFIPNYQYYSLADKNQFRYTPPRTTASVLGMGQTRYAGVRQIYTTLVSIPLTGAPDPNNPSVQLTFSGVDPRIPVLNQSVYILKDDTRGGGIETYDCNAVGGVPLSLPQIQAMATAFVDKDNNWKNEADNGVITQEDLLRGATANGTNGVDEGLNDDAAIDAHWGAGIVYDYWKSIHKRLSYDNKNTSIKSYVHYGPAYDNAFWNGTSMTYGDGSGTTAMGFKPLVSLDVCGHEIGHGVCSFTSDLAYESESGAMNEGLSDIWAAAVERFAKNTVDNTLNYQYFQVGEQIAADGIGLRRMDNPKSNSNPDTYGGRYWQDPNCIPTLANDQCGVHGNSGVLNKWFYLLVQGKGTTTGLPAFTDDGRADALGTTVATENLGNNYGILPNFTGVGFDKAEQITYLMELNLTPNAKFAEARTVSILAARVLYGTCSPEEVNVTNAWFGVNVGAAWAGCTAPVLSVNLIDTTINEGSGDCGSFTEYTIGVSLTIAQLTATNINFSVGGTAEAHDYLFSASSINFAASETGNKTIKLRIFNDDMVEGDETITLGATSNVAGFNFNQTITVVDDDVLPKLGNTFMLLTENFESVAADALPGGWARVNKTNPSGGEWNVRQTPGASTVTWITKRAYVYSPTTAALLKGQATYDPMIGSNIILRTKLIDARGLDSIRLRFMWSGGGETACSPACDYGDVVYSFDGVNFNRFDVDTATTRSASEPLYLSPADSTYNFVLPPVVSNKQFYIGFRWVNDDLLTVSPNSITIDNVMVTGQGRKIESDSASGVTTTVRVEPGNPVYFYSERDKGLLSSIVNSSLDLGCVKDSLIQTGNGVVPYAGGLRTRKVFEITPSQNNGAIYTLSLYFTTAEVAGFSAAPSQLRILKSNAVDINNSTAGNSIIVGPTFTDSSAQGFYIYTYTFTGFSKFALVEPSAAPLPVNCLDFKAVKGNNNVSLNWKTANDEAGTVYEIERSSDGSNFQRVGSTAGNRSGLYNFTDRSIAGLKAAHYRIKAIEANGAAKYLCTILYITFDARNVFVMGNIYPNPGKGQAIVNVTVSNAYKLRIEYVNAIGQMVNADQQQLVAGATQVQLNVRALAAGSYLVRFKDDEGRVVNTQQFVKQ